MASRAPAGGAAALAAAMLTAATTAAPTPAAPTPAPGASSPEASFDVAVVLLGSVAFVMALFYLLHFPDQDIRTYSWNVVSMSICTFTGVLIGMSWGGCFTFFVVGPPAVAGPLKTIVGDACACLGWYALLQLVLAWVSGAVGGQPKSTRSMVLNMKCFAVLLGITNGASNLTLWGLVQQNAPRDLAWTAAVIPVAGVALWIMFKVGEVVRNQVARSDDDRFDEFEEVWIRFTEETEDATVSMTLAHLVVQVTRFRITGNLPLPGGQVAPGMQMKPLYAAELIFAGLAYSALIPITSLFAPKALGRGKGWLKKIAGNCTAFSWLYGFSWLIHEQIDVMSPPGSMLLALAVTLAAFALIFILDAIIDMPCTGEEADKEVQGFIAPLSLLIGFAWKQAFVAALTTTTSRQHWAPPPVETLSMAAILVLVVVPAWRMYILPVIMEGEMCELESHIADEHAADKGHLPWKPIGRRHTDSHLASKVKPLLTNVGGPEGEEDWIGAFDHISKVEVHPEELSRRNLELARRNADLEASLVDIQEEVRELKKMATLLR